MPYREASGPLAFLMEWIPPTASRCVKMGKLKSSYREERFMDEVAIIGVDLAHQAFRRPHPATWVHQVQNESMMRRQSVLFLYFIMKFVPKCKITLKVDMVSHTFGI